MNIALIALGLAGGIVSGLVGIGGGIFIAPALMFLMKFSQHQAQGTTLALMVPPVGILAAYDYYKHGYVDLKVSALIACGFIVGSLLGARISNIVPDQVLTKIFASFLVVIAIKLFIGK